MNKMEGVTYVIFLNFIGLCSTSDPNMCRLGICCTGYMLHNNRCTECEAGTRGINCSKTCPDGYYGRLCKEVCSTDCKGTCNKVNGSCPDEDDSHVSVDIDRPHSTHESVTCRCTVNVCWWRPGGRSLPNVVTI
ncbi:multiple epidermal growth factor-like domains protein 10 isoform X2 [Ostrea edulis]|uniref:multiple epidermal growth factor-like domains protein 10 isoform X2 n=1 Tax=Ostrea edulis TaxID=37623 RepID=UPI0020945947|nr:multiple epidermal growth factor-like domains protein 10 isoform X2 [Ostrea edulis]